MKTNQASVTAFNVQQGILLIARHHRYKGLVPEEMVTASRRILAASKEGTKYLRRTESLWFRALSPLLEYLLIPGIRLHYVLRKRYIEEVTRQALDDGIRQVVNLGAGLDTLLWRLHTPYPDASFIELDRTETLALKRQAVTTGSNLHLLDIDFSKHSIADFLEEQSCFSPTEPTVFICESVLMYLEESVVIAFFQDLRRLMNADSKVIFSSLVPPGSADHMEGILLKAYLKLQREPLKWSIASNNLSDFLQAQGFTLEHTTHSGLLGNQYLGPSRREFYNRTESLAVATISQKSK